jgi:hypothetical protein
MRQSASLLLPADGPARIAIMPLDLLQFLCCVTFSTDTAEQGGGHAE